MSNWCIDIIIPLNHLIRSAGRMKAKGCISAVLEWPTAREFFYWRIRRRQAEDPLKDRLVAASNGALTLDTAADRVSTSAFSFKRFKRSSCLFLHFFSLACFLLVCFSLFTLYVYK